MPIEIGREQSRAQLTDDAYVDILPLTWGEGEEIDAASRDPETGRLDLSKSFKLTLLKSIKGFAGFVAKGDKAALVYPQDLEKLVDGLPSNLVTKLYRASRAIHEEGNAVLGNS